jgi:hypothetical protein
VSRAIWERLDTETATAFSAFVVYRDLAPHERSISRVASEIAGRRTDGKGAGAGLRRRLEGWSSRHRWSERCRAWDGLLDERRQAAMLDAAVEAGERQVLEARVHLRAMSAVAMVLVDLMRDPERERELRSDLEALPKDRLVALAAMCARYTGQLHEAERVALGFRSETAMAAAASSAAVAREAARAEPAPEDDMVSAARLWAVMDALDEVGYVPPLLRLAGGEERPDA